MRLLGKILLTCAGVMFFSFQAFAAEGGAIAATNARSAAGAQAAANLGAGGPGPDLKAIAGPRQPQTFTGFPAGTLPGGGSAGGSGGSVSVQPSGERVVLSGDPQTPLMGPELVGSSLDRVYLIAGHAGYTIINRAYTPNTMDVTYTLDAMNGRSRKARLYFDRSMKVLSVEN